MKYGSLNHEQARFYRDQGYYRLTNVLNPDESTQMREFIESEASAYSEDFDPSNPNMKLYGLYDRSPEIMQKVIGNKALVGALVSLLGPNVVFVKNRHNHATINNMQGEPAEGMHRDILQPSRGLLTAVVYLQDSTVNNGATRLIPGSHNLPYVGVPQEDGGGTWMSEHDEYTGLEDQAVPIPMLEGDVLLFNGTLFHGVGYNESGEARTSVTLGFRSVDELSTSPDISREELVSGEYIYRGNDR